MHNNKKSKPKNKLAFFKTNYFKRKRSPKNDDLLPLKQKQQMRFFLQKRKIDYYFSIE